MQQDPQDSIFWAHAVQWHALSLPVVETLLLTDFRAGLSSEEAEARLRILQKHINAWQKLRLAFGRNRKEKASQVVTVVRDGRQRIMPSWTIVPGDVIDLHPGSQAPSDARIVSSWELTFTEGVAQGLKTISLAQTPHYLISKGSLVLQGDARIVALPSAVSGF